MKILFSIVFMILLASPTLAFMDSKDDLNVHYELKEEYNPECFLTECRLPARIRYVDNKLIDSRIIDVSQLEYALEGRYGDFNIKSLEIRYPHTVYDQVIDTWDIDCETLYTKNLTPYEVCTDDIKYKNVERIEWTAQPTKEIFKNQWVDIMIVGKIDPCLNCGADFQPIIFDVKLKDMAWQRSGWGKRKNITFNSTNAVGFFPTTVSHNLTAITCTSGNCENEVVCVNETNITKSIDFIDTDNSTFAEISIFLDEGRLYNTDKVITCYYDNGSPPTPSYTDHVILSGAGNVAFNTSIYTGTVTDADGIISSLVFDSEEKLDDYATGIMGSLFYTPTNYYFHIGEGNDDCDIIYDGNTYGMVKCEANEDNTYTNYTFYPYEIIAGTYADLSIGWFAYLDNTVSDKQIMLVTGATNTTATGNSNYEVNEPVACWGDSANANSMCVVWTETGQTAWNKGRTRIDAGSGRVAFTIMSDSGDEHQSDADEIVDLRFYINITADHTYQEMIVNLLRYENPLIGYQSAEESDGDTTAPTFNVSTNSTSTTVVNTLALFNLTWNDDTALNNSGQYIFSSNNSGTWTNLSAVNFTTTPDVAGGSVTLNATNNSLIQWRIYATDNAGNWNTSLTFNLTTTQTGIVVPVSSYSLCSDNNTLFINRTVVINAVANNSQEYVWCASGCDNITFVCNPTAYQQNLYNFAIVMGIFVFFALLIKWRVH